MTPASYKFGWIPNGTEEQPYSYSNGWVRERTTGPDRLLIAPAGGHVDLLLQLAKELQEPFWVLYIMVVSRANSELGRYESKAALSSEELSALLREYTNYLENDARHHLWIFSPENEATIVYDNHNVIYAYGPLDRFSAVLENRGLIRADRIRFPKPHTHRYNAEFDLHERDILRAIPWQRTPLRDEDQ